MISESRDYDEGFVKIRLEVVSERNENRQVEEREREERRLTAERDVEREERRIEAGIKIAM